MTISNLKAAIAAYHQKGLADFTVSGVDLVLLAINNARKAADRVHDWNAQQMELELSVVPSTGGDLAMAFVEGDEENVKRIKTIDCVYFKTADGNLIPIELDTKKNVGIWAKERIRRRALGLRYPSDADLTMADLASIGRGRRPLIAYQHGNSLFLDPPFTEAQKIAIDASVWLDDYTDDEEDEDWMLLHGADYLMWAGVCEINYFAQSFVVRGEGILSPPERVRDQKLQELILWDSYQIETGRQMRGSR